MVDKHVFKKYQLLSSVVLINLLSKVIGFIREVVISSTFGVSRITDVFFGVQQIPAFIGNYVGGAFNIAFIPYYNGLNNNKARLNFILGICKIFVLLGIVISSLSIVFAKEIVGFFAKVTATDVEIRFVVYIALSVIPVSLNMLVYNILHSERRNAQAMMQAMIAPVIMLLTLVLLSRIESMKLLALPISFLFGSVFSMLISVFLIWNTLITYKKSSSQHENNASIKNNVAFVKQVSATSVENVAFNINQSLNISFSAASGIGGAAIYIFATRIALLPLSGVITPLSQVLQSRIRPTVGGAILSYQRSLISIILIALLVAIFVATFRYEIVHLVYQRGSFTPEDTLRVSNLLVPYSFYLFVMAVNQTLARLLFSFGEGVFYTRIMVIAYITSNLIKPLLLNKFSGGGVVWACVICEGIAGIILMTHVVRLGQHEK